MLRLWVVPCLQLTSCVHSSLLRTSRMDGGGAHPAAVFDDISGRHVSPVVGVQRPEIVEDAAGVPRGVGENLGVLVEDEVS